MKLLTTLTLAAMLLATAACGDKKPYVKHGNIYKVYGNHAEYLSTATDPTIKSKVSELEETWYNIDWGTRKPPEGLIERTKACMDAKYPEDIEVEEWIFMKELIDCRFISWI